MCSVWCVTHSTLHCTACTTSSYHQQYLWDVASQDVGVVGVMGVTPTHRLAWYAGGSSHHATQQQWITHTHTQYILTVELLRVLSRCCVVGVTAQHVVDAVVVVAAAQQDSSTVCAPRPQYTIFSLYLSTHVVCGSSMCGCWCCCWYSAQEHCACTPPSISMTHRIPHTQ